MSDDMSAGQRLRDQVVHDVFVDFMEHVRRPQGAGDDWVPTPQDSIICRYYLETLKCGFRVRVRWLWCERGTGKRRNAELIKYLADCLGREGRFQRIVVPHWARIEPLMRLRRRDAGRPAGQAKVLGKARALGKEMRDEMAAIAGTGMSPEEWHGAISDDELHALADVMLDATVGKGLLHQAESLLAYRQELIAERRNMPVLGGDVERTRMLADVQEAFDGDLPRPHGDGDVDFKNRMDAALFSVLAAAARQWLQNCGCSLSAGDVPAEDACRGGIVRTYDIPVGLMALWRDEMDGAVGSATSPDDAVAGDAFRLYRSLIRAGRPARRMMVPLRRHLGSGDAIYLLGSDLASVQIEWLQKAAQSDYRLRSQVASRRGNVAARRPGPAADLAKIRNRRLDDEKKSLRRRDMLLSMMRRRVKADGGEDARDCVLSLATHDPRGDILAAPVVARGRLIDADEMAVSFDFQESTTVMRVLPDDPEDAAQMAKAMHELRLQGKWGRMYRDANGFAPEGCPDRYREYFE